MDTRIYVMTHKAIEPINDDLYHILHVGKKGKPDLGFQGDDTGDNISEKNASYCELTGMYWLWKNCECDIIGICHYRRFFIHNEKLLDREYIEKTITDYPIILPKTCCIYDGTIRDAYKLAHNVRDLDICKDVIYEKYPDYIEAYDYVMNGMLFTAGNMWITRKDIYDRYCKWLFDILFEVEKRINIESYDDYQKRVMGFLSERLFRVWLCMQNEQIKEINVKMIETRDFNNADKEIELKARLLRLKMRDFLEYWKQESKENCIIPKFMCRDDFDGGKIPVWVAWWQGIEEAPELVKICIDSLKKNLPENIVTFRIITLENCMDYVTFSDAIINKFNSGIIDYTKLSDILRSELLYRYGGMWIDAAYWVTQPIGAGLFMDNRLHTIRFKKPVWRSDITKGRWSGNFWITPAGQELFRFMTEAFMYYVEIEDEFIDYFMIDYLVDIAVELEPQIDEQLKNSEIYTEKILFLKEKINKCCNEKEYKKIKQEAPLYKLDRRAGYVEQNIVDKRTVYGYMKEEMINDGVL